MAVRSDRTFSILILVLSLFFVLGGELAIFQGIETQQGQAVATVIGGLLRDESMMSRSYLIAQSLEDLQAYGVIKCARLKLLNGTSTILFYDSSFRPACEKSRLVSVILPGLNGQDWEIAAQPTLTTPFLILKWITMILSLLILLLSHKTFAHYFRRERLRRELAEAQSTSLTNMAQQVRHDVASPITALKIVANNAELDFETKNLLKIAVERTQEIFNSLNKINKSDFEVSLIKTIDEIRFEKTNQTTTYPAIQVDMDDTKLNLPKSELGRIISNIFDNSFQAGATKIRLWKSETAQQVSIFIDDDGQKISEGVIAKIGTRGNTHGKRIGTGLGLYHCYSVMRSIGGRLIVKSCDPKIELQFVK